MTTHTEHSSGPRWKRRKEARPGEIIAAALELFVEHGYAATRLEDVAQRAGVTKGTMYLYFPSKEELFKAVVRENVLPAIEQGEREAALHEGSAADLVRRLVMVWYQAIVVGRTGGLAKLMMAESHNFPDLAAFYHVEVVQRGQALFARAIQGGVDRGEFRPVDVRSAVRLATSPLLVAGIWKHSFSACERGGFDTDSIVALHLDIFLRGLAAHPESAHA